MSRQFWSEQLAWAVADGTAIANTVTETIIFPNITIPANYMADGRTVRLTAFGKYSTTGAPTMIFRLRWGGVSGTVLALSETFTLGTTQTNLLWGLDAMIQTRSNGATGSLIVAGGVDFHTTTTAMTRNLWGVSGGDAPAAVTVDLTADTALSLTATWGTASASNTLTGLIYNLESLN